MKRFERLKAWQACHQLNLDLHRHTAAHPDADLFRWLRSAAGNAADRVTRGASEENRDQFAHYLAQALESLAELAYPIRLARDLGMINSTIATELEIARDHARKLTWGLRATLQNGAQKKEPRRGSSSSVRTGTVSAVLTPAEPAED